MTITVYSVPVANNDSYTVVSGQYAERHCRQWRARQRYQCRRRPLTAVLGHRTDQWQLTLNADGSFSYTPNRRLLGHGQLHLYRHGWQRHLHAATVTITVYSIPVANADAYTRHRGNTLTVTAANGVLANDTNADGNALSAVLAPRPANGSLTLNADGSFSYTPNAGFSGTDSFTYTATDGMPPPRRPR